MADATGADGGHTDRDRRRGERGDPAGPAPRAAIVRGLLVVSGLALLASAALYHPPLLARLRGEALSPLAREAVGHTRLGFALTGLALLGLAEVLRRVPRAARLAERPAVARIALVVWAIALPLGILDFGLRPFVPARTTLFEADPDLGWRLRPGAHSEWGGVRVSVNAQGLRGPAVARPKPPGVERVLFLGDSVTFGYGLADPDDAFPARVAAELARAGGRRVEAVNAGVGGWSPWQEARFLEREGWAYEPDVLVVGFVLNDVTEKLSLVRFGGTGEGWQLLHTARGRIDRWLSGSAVAAELRALYARLRFGPDVRRGAAREEAADVKRLVAHPGDDDPVLAHGWRITLANLARIFDAARAREVPALLVVFPYRFQLAAPARRAGPQRRLREFARSRGIAFLDLLPAFAAHAGEDLFLDESHPTPAGHRLAAAAIAGAVRAHGWLPRTPGGGS